jgi:hypothetical protein
MGKEHAAGEGVKRTTHGERSKYAFVTITLQNPHMPPPIYHP